MADGHDFDGGEDDHGALEELTFAEAHRRIGAGDRLPGESTEDPSAVDAAHWIQVYSELVRFKRELLTVARTQRRGLSIHADLEGAADEALISGQLHRYELRLEEWQAARAGGVRSPADDGVDGRLVVEGPVRSLGPLTIDPRERSIIKDGQRIETTPTEWKLLRVLLEHPDRTLTREQLAEWAWGSAFGCRTSEVEVYVSRLRRKLEGVGSPRLIETVRGVGYRLVPPEGLDRRVGPPSIS
jgi:DNA-binding winged helix-turn-helix (wHTH) protein